MAFTREVFDAVSGDWQEIEQMNDVLQRLRERRRSFIKPGGEFDPSRLAWKIGGFPQAIFYRTVMLAEGCSLMWNGRNILGAMLCARID